MRSSSEVRRGVARVAALAAAGWLLVATLPAHAAWGRRVGEPFHWSGSPAAGKILEVKGVNGPIRAVAASGNVASVDARKTSRRNDPDEVKIEVIESEDGIMICARYPKLWGGLTDCEGGGGSMRNSDVNVDFEVRVPAGVRFVARSVNGEIEAEGLRSEVSAATVNGSVRIATSRHAEAKTVNGSIHARLGAGDWRQDLEFATVNGAIELELPAGLDADLSAATVNGEIESDFPLQVTGRLGRHRVHGTIGKGGRQLRLATVNGGIHLTRLGSL